MNTACTRKITIPIYILIKKPLNALLLFCCLFFFSSDAKGQSESLKTLFPKTVDSLHFYQNHNKSILKFGNYLKDLQDSISDSENVDLLYDIKTYLDWVIKHPSADSLFIRNQYTYYAYKLKKDGGDYDLAIEYYSLAHHLGGDLSFVNDVFYVEHPLGIYYNMKGDHDRSLYFYKKTIARLNELITDKTVDNRTLNTFRIQQARVNNNLGFLYSWNQEYDQALDTLYAALQELQVQSFSKGVAYSYQYLGETYAALNKIDSIQRYAHLIKDILPKLSKKTQVTMQVVHHQLLGKVATLTKDNKNAVTEFETALKIKQDSKTNHHTRFFAKAHNALAKAYLNSNRLDEAKKSITRGIQALSLDITEVLNHSKYLYEENSIAELLETNASYYQKKYNQTKQIAYLDSALINLNRSIEVYDLLRYKYLLNGSKLLSIAENRRLVEKSIDILFQKQEIIGPSLSIINEVESLFTQSKNLLLFEYNNERHIINSLSKEKRIEIKKHQTQIQVLTSALVDKKQTQPKDQIISEIVEHRRSIKAFIGEKNIDKSVFFNENYVEFLLGKKHLYSIDNFSKKKVFRKLAEREKIVLLIQQSQQGIKEKQGDDSFYKIQSRLYQLLFGQMGILPPQFTIIPDDLLSFLAFPALITNFSERRYLIEDHIIKIAFDKTVNQDKSTIEKHLVTIAPIYPKKITETPQKKGDFYYLPEAKGEIDSIIRMWPGELSQYENITKLDFFESLKKASIVHYAGHAIVDGDHGFIVLGNDASSWVSHEEIAQFTNPPHTVILSACETGLGKLNYGEGVSSLAKSFLLGGTQSIIYSLWSVNDQTTAQLMKSFYHHQYEGNNLASSMAYAQRKLLIDYNHNIHPYYWAAFTVVEKSDQKNNFKLTLRMGLLFLFSITLIGVLYFLIKRNS